MPVRFPPSSLAYSTCLPTRLSTTSPGSLSAGTLSSAGGQGAQGQHGSFVSCDILLSSVQTSDDTFLRHTLVNPPSTRTSLISPVLKNQLRTLMTLTDLRPPVPLKFLKSSSCTGPQMSHLHSRSPMTYSWQQTGLLTILILLDLQISPSQPPSSQTAPLVSITVSCSPPWVNL